LYVKEVAYKRNVFLLNQRLFFSIQSTIYERGSAFLQEMPNATAKKQQKTLDFHAKTGYTKFIV